MSLAVLNRPARPLSFLMAAPLVLVAFSAPLAAQTVLNGNHSVDGRLCVGDACTASETFGDIDLKLKGINNRLRLEDTSTTAGFPTVDWELQANDEASAGDAYFAIRNVDTNSQILRLESGAPANSFFVSDTGSVGLGTILPQGDLHIVGGDNAAFRLTADTAPGGTVDFDLFVDELGFAVQRTVNKSVPLDVRLDAPNGAMTLLDTRAQVNRLQNPSFNFRYSSGNDADAFFIEGDNGNVGIGTSVPTQPLHVQSTDGSASILVNNTVGSPSAVREMFKMANNGGSFFTLDNTQSGTTWFFVHENAAPNRFLITDGVNDGPEMVVSAEGNLTIQGQLFTAGSCSAGCDRVFDADYPLPTIAEQAAMMKANRHLPNVGPTPEDGPFNITAMTGGMLNELEKAHLYIAELETRLSAIESKLAAND